MIKNKKMFLFMTLLILMVGISVVSATDSTDDASDVSTISSDVSTTTHTDTSSSVSSDSSSSSSSNSVSSDSSDGSSISHVATTSSSSMSSQKADTTTSDSSSSSHESTQSSTSSDTKTVSSSTNSSSVSNSDNKDIKTQESTSTNTSAKENSNTNINTIATSSSDSIRTMATTYEVNNSTFDNYFSENTLNVPDGSTISFTSNVERYGKSYTIDKSVNILGNNYSLNLDTASLTITSSGSNSNISQLTFVNTHVSVSTASNVVFDQINYNVAEKVLGSGVGCFAIRGGSINVTVKNSNFDVSNNGGHSIIALTMVENCILDNNTIIGTGQVGNLVYLNVYNVDDSYPNGIKENKNNTISNNIITGPSSPLAICYAVSISGNENKIINNTIDYGGYAITTNWIGNITNSTEDPGDDHNISYYDNQIANNHVNGGMILTSGYSNVTGNTFSGRVTVNSHSRFINNNVEGSVAFVGNDMNIRNNVISDSATINGDISTWYENSVGNLTVSGTYNLIQRSEIGYLLLTANSSYNRVSNNTFKQNYTDLGSNNVISSTNTVSSSNIGEFEEISNTKITVDDIVAKYNDSIKLRAEITSEDGNTVNQGQVSFKLNGVTLKDEDGNNILVNVRNGIATLDYTITNNPGTYNISAVYSGTDQYQSSRTENDATLTVENRVANLTIASKSNNLKSGERLLITVVVSDNNKYVSDGVIIYKLNGVTLKDEEGNNLQSTLSKGVATLEYTIPVDMAGKDYTLTAVYSGKNFDRAEQNATLTLIKSNVTAVISPSIIDQGENATVSVTLFDQNGNQLERSTKVTIKANGKTLLNTETVNGVLNVTIPTDTFKNPYYNLTVIFGENSAYNELRLNTTLVVESNSNVADLKTELKADSEDNIVILTQNDNTAIYIINSDCVTLDDINENKFLNIYEDYNIVLENMLIDSYVIENEDSCVKIDNNSNAVFVNIESTDTFKNPYYNITVTLEDYSQYNGLTLDTILVVNNIVSSATIKESANSTNAIIE